MLTVEIITPHKKKTEVKIIHKEFFPRAQASKLPLLFHLLKTRAALNGF